MLFSIAVIFYYVGSFDYSDIFAMKYDLANTKFTTRDDSMNLSTLVAIGFMIGAMGKSAQVPLHVWLPESMEGPTPISALIHAATMVTAGIYLLVRMSPIMEYAPFVGQLILLIGSIGTLILGLVGVVQNDVKRVVAYSTLSQLGFMMAAVGAGGYSSAMFHLVTHAFFKALLFLAAGSVIVGMHHIQDMRQMGGLFKFMPITHMCFFVGVLALSGLPPFSGFFSKDSIFFAIKNSEGTARFLSYYLLLAATFVSSLYSVRALVLTFYGRGPKIKGIKESDWTITSP